MAQFILVAVTLAGIYYQLRAQRTASLHAETADWTREATKEESLLWGLAALTDFVDRPIELGMPPTAAATSSFFERLGYLVGQKHLRSADVWHLLRIDIGTWWSIMGPYILRERKTLGTDSLYEWFEKLELEMQRLDRQIVGRILEFPMPPEELRKFIDEVASGLKVFVKARNGILPEAPPVAAPTVNPTVSEGG
jgi:hypothetical protein